MVDLTEFEALSNPHPTRCKLARHLDALSKKDRELCQAAVDAPHITSGAIMRWLDARGLRLGEAAVKKHRSGDCCCG